MAIVGIAVFAIWQSNRSAAAAATATAQAAQSRSEAATDRAALKEAVEGSTDESVVKSLNDNTF